MAGIVAVLSLQQSTTTLQPIAFVTALQKWPDGRKLAVRIFDKHWSGHRQVKKRTAVV